MDMDIPTISTGPQLLWSIILAGFIILLSTISNRRRPKGFPAGPLSLPIIGNLHQLGTHPFIKFIEMRKKYGDVFAVDFASYRGIVINDAKLIREAFNMPEFSGRARLRPFLEKSGDGQFRGIIMNDGPTQQEQRRFAMRNLRDFGMGKRSLESIIQGEMEELMNTLAKYDGNPFQTKYIFNLSAVNSLWWIIVGERFAHDDKRLREIVKLLTDGLIDSPSAGAFFFFPWLSRIAPNLTGYNSFMTFQFEVAKLVEQKYREQRASFQSGKQRHFLDVFIEEVVGMKDPTSAFYGVEGEKNLVASVTDLFLAGIETTATTMSWAVLLLALHPQVQDKMFDEINTIAGVARPPTLDDEKNMPYIQAVFTEISRFSSILPLSAFHSTLEDVTFNGYRIPKDTMVVPNLYAAHHDPDVWGDPSKFRPERFMTSDGKFSKPGESFMAFSVGKRVCVGEALARNTLFLFLANLCQRFQIIPNPEHPTPIIDYTPTFVLQPKPYEYVLIPRT